MIYIQAGDNHPLTSNNGDHDDKDEDTYSISNQHNSQLCEDDNSPPRALDALTRFSYLVQELDIYRSWNNILDAAASLVHRQAHLLQSITLTSDQFRVEKSSGLSPADRPPWNIIVSTLTAATCVSSSTRTHHHHLLLLQEQEPQRRSRLQSLTLNHIALCPRDLEEAGTRELLIGLETLVLKATVLHRNETTKNEYQTLPLWNLEGAKIRHLELVNCEHDYPSDHLETEYGLLLDCQKIRSLNWRRYWQQIQRPVSVQSNLVGGAEFLDEEKGKVNVLDLFPQDLRRGRWPFLERLDLQSTEIPDRAMAEILSSLGRPLRSLNAISTGFGPLCARALLGQPFDFDQDGKQGHNVGMRAWTGPKHSTALEVLYFHACHNVTSAMVQEFLCSFPKLQEFRARLLKEEDVLADPRPWVCKEIKVLELHFAMLNLTTQVDGTGETIPVIHVPQLVAPPFPPFSPTITKRTIPTIPGSTVLLDRLAELTQLVEYSSGNHLYTNRDRNDLIIGEDGRLFPSLLFRLEGNYDKSSCDHPDFAHVNNDSYHGKGLDRLRTWRQLRRVKLIDPAQQIWLSDAKWMVDHWPLLEEVLSFRWNLMSPDQNEVKDCLNAHGVIYR
ncbi:hypothetical protein BGZ83_011769 [Gryganskiella cystojenkinii]|nr:hypothetical protein BGZ83_011769 [Gryganskiella cystojenkinii]